MFMSQSVPSIVTTYRLVKFVFTFHIHYIVFAIKDVCRTFLNVATLPILKYIRTLYAYLRRRSFHLFSFFYRKTNSVGYF